MFYSSKILTILVKQLPYQYMDLQSSIQNLGFSEKEARVYLALLQTGQATAYQVAKRSGLKTPTTYVILDELLEKGAVRKILTQKATHYAATDPVELFVTARSRIEQAQTALPSLQAMAQNDNKVVQASYYEGVSGIKDMYKKLLDEMPGKTFVAFFAHGKDTSKALWEYWSTLNKQMVERKIKVRAITTEDKTTQPWLSNTKVPKEFMEIKGLPESIYSSNISIEIYNNRTQIISHRYEQAIMIDNPDIANVLRQIFEIVWKK